MTADASPLVDPFGRSVDYLRLSVTDRCDLRCVYCMSEEMEFLPRSEILAIEELERVARSFVSLGVRKIRITGGEPLVRQGVLKLLDSLGQLPGLDELVMTTNGAQLGRYAERIRAAGVRRLNISLDSLDPERFHRITRTGRLHRVLDGIEAARDAGFDRLRLNVIAMRGRNDDEIPDLVEFATQRGLDISFIEEMPMGALDGHDRGEAFMSSDEVRAEVERTHPLARAEPKALGGPSRDYRVAGSNTRVGFISPHSHNFCASCNRVRVTVDGMLMPCLGREQATDLRPVLRDYGDDPEPLHMAIQAGIQRKPESHVFDASALSGAQVVRFMSVTGG